jgi:hypothetical protein
MYQPKRPTLCPFASVEAILVRLAAVPRIGVARDLGQPTPKGGVWCSPFDGGRDCVARGQAKAMHACTW